MEYEHVAPVGRLIRGSRLARTRPKDSARSPPRVPNFLGDSPILKAAARSEVRYLAHSGRPLRRLWGG
jgi:hypothetical protein